MCAEYITRSRSSSLVWRGLARLRSEGMTHSFVRRFPISYINPALAVQEIRFNLLKKITFIEIFTCLFHKWLQLLRLFAFSINNNDFSSLRGFSVPFLISPKDTYAAQAQQTYPHNSRNHRLNGKWLLSMFVLLLLSFLCSIVRFVRLIRRAPIFFRLDFSRSSGVLVVCMATVLRSTTTLINVLCVKWIDSHVILAPSIPTRFVGMAKVCRGKSCVHAVQESHSLRCWQSSR